MRNHWTKRPYGLYRIKTSTLQDGQEFVFDPEDFSVNTNSYYPAGIYVYVMKFGNAWSQYWGKTSKYGHRSKEEVSSYKTVYVKELLEGQVEA